MTIRLTTPGVARPRPEMAAAFLTPEQKLDEGIGFDPQRDIPKEDRMRMTKALKQGLQTSPRSYIYNAMRFSLLFPEQKKDLEAKLVGLPWGELMAQLGEFRQREGLEWAWASFSSLAVPLAVLFPERRGELGLDNQAWEGMKGVFEHRRKELGLLSSLEAALPLAILFPERRGELGLDEDVWSKIQVYLGEYHKRQDWDTGVDKLAYVALLFPEHRGELRLDDQSWKILKKPLERTRKQKDWRQYLNEAFNLTILAAEDARITGEGRIRITPKKPDLAAEPAPLPARPR